MGQTRKADFECDGCGWEGVGERPTSCPKCQGQVRAAYRPRIEGHTDISEALGRIRNMAKDVRIAVDRLQHPRRKLIGRKMHGVAGLTAAALEDLSKAV